MTVHLLENSNRAKEGEGSFYLNVNINNSNFKTYKFLQIKEQPFFYKLNVVSSKKRMINTRIFMYVTSKLFF